MAAGREFQIVGAAKAKERLPVSVSMRGVTSWFWRDGRRDLDGL
jgi:hypothetical protein